MNSESFFWDADELSRAQSAAVGPEVDGEGDADQLIRHVAVATFTFGSCSLKSNMFNINHLTIESCYLQYIFVYNFFNHY